MTRLRTLLIRTPGISALAAMLALVAVAWATPKIGAPRIDVAQSRPIA